jgi:4-amino-4-deoxy-L-arabinose transferase-like glycosyltransferase
MKDTPRVKIVVRWVFLCLGAVLYLGWLLAGLRDVPFHPDETTWIYMSRDLDRLITRGPASLCWQPELAGNPLQTERERACPLPRFLIGAARRLDGQPAVASDWNWIKSWDENSAQGALPTIDELITARIPQALLVFLSTLLMIRIGWRLGGWPGAVTAAVLFGLNSQMLLHGRHAMSEASLLFGMILVAAIAIEAAERQGGKRKAFVVPLWIGFALAVALSAKLTGILMAPAALAGVYPFHEKAPLRSILLRWAGRIVVLGCAFALVFLLLNPYYWCHPVDAAAAVASSRNQVISEQIRALQFAEPGLILNSPGRRVLAVFYESFLAPLSFWDVPNYAAFTAGAERAYLANPLQTLTTGGVLSALWCVLSLAGLVVGLARSLRPGRDGKLVILWFWTLSVLGGILWEVPFMWQRYYLPLVPILVAWAVLAVSAISATIRSRMVKSLSG